MRIGIFVPSIGQFGNRLFYNAQEIGLAKAMDRICEEVKVYRLVDSCCETTGEWLEGCRNTYVQFIPSRKIGSNGLVDLKIFDKTLDAMVFFSDTQFVVPAVYRWARKNGVCLIPYIGVIASRSTGNLKRMLMDTLFCRNLAVYKKLHCMVKTPKVKEELSALGVKDITVAPVGLDFSLLHDNTNENADLIRREIGFQPDDKLVLMVGRLEKDRNPLDCVTVFRKLYERDPRYKLCLVGKGSLKEELFQQFREDGLENAVYYFERIPNDQMWKFYTVSELLISFSRTEIFGMSILEAMYYGIPVFAVHAPGPDFILEHKVSGFLSGGPEEMVEQILNGGDRSAICERAFERVTTKFSWNTTAEIVMREIECEA